MGEDIDQMLDNMRADSWSDVSSAEDYVFTEDTRPPLERLESYIDYCFETYDVVSAHLDRGQVQACIADWDKRRGQHRPNTEMRKQVFGKQVRSKWRKRVEGNHAVFVSKPLIGVPPEDDNGAGWKACVRHELGHAIDHQKRGTSDHGHKFKAIMRQFGEQNNDGGYAHGYYPRSHR